MNFSSRVCVLCVQQISSLPQFEEKKSQVQNLNHRDARATLDIISLTIYVGILSILKFVLEEKLSREILLNLPYTYLGQEYPKSILVLFLISRNFEYVEFDRYVLSFMVTFGSIPFSYYSLSSIHNMNVLLDLYNTLTVCIFVLCMQR